jgi:transposase InsO family protein
MRYAFIAEHADEHGVERMCRLLQVGRSGYYAWKRRAPSPRSQTNQMLTSHIRTEFALSRKSYGSPRLYRALRTQGLACGRHRVARLMRQAHLQARPQRRWHPITTQRDPERVAAPNLLAQEFHAQAPNQKWVSDFTYIATREGWLYLAVVLDLFSRRVIGWSMQPTRDNQLVEAALHMALANRQPPPGLLHHSDQGSQYTSAAYLDCLVAAQAKVSMSRVGNCYDNAVAESFFATLKAECATGVFPTRAQARATIFEYLEVWYNRQRLHSSLGYSSPVNFERQFSL